MRYFWGMRGADLADALAVVGVVQATTELLSELCSSERSERARALSVELGRLATALDERGLWR